MNKNGTKKLAVSIAISLGTGLLSADAAGVAFPCSMDNTVHINGCVCIFSL